MASLTRRIARDLARTKRRPRPRGHRVAGSRTNRQLTAARLHYVAVQEEIDKQLDALTARGVDASVAPRFTVTRRWPSA